MKPELHERKWEIDSLCYPVRLAHGYWKQTGDASCFDSNWRRATLKRTHAGAGFMHESFSKDDGTKFTRSWFAWADRLFGELILHVLERYPQLL